MKVLIAFVPVMILLAGCAGNRLPGQSGPIVDTQGVDMSRYQADLADCEALAEQVPVGERASTQAAVGAAVGGAVGAIVNNNNNSAARGAGVGAVGGAVRGTSSGLSEKEQVMHNCLRGRGYRVLN